MYGIEDCIAMSEDGDWLAFPEELTRGQVISALADGGEWIFVLQAYVFSRGYVRATITDWGEGWWEQCDADAPGAEAAWIVRRKNAAWADR
jgi:hypothetical protein